MQIECAANSSSDNGKWQHTGAGLHYLPGQAVIILHAHMANQIAPESHTITETFTGTVDRNPINKKLFTSSPPSESNKCLMSTS